ncbi:hypothetical protein SALBM311S_09448 [Streptomyces alboniger]
MLFCRTSSRRSCTTWSNTDSWSTLTSAAAALYDSTPTSTVTAAVTVAKDSAKVVRRDSSRGRREESSRPRRPTQSSRST